MNPALTTPLCFAVHTDPGDGEVLTECFPTAQARLESLRGRAQEYFPGTNLPTPRGEHQEDAYLAQLLGFFLMLSDGSVTLSQKPADAECTHIEE